MQTDPIEYPTIDIGGETLTVKFRCGDIIRLKQTAGVDLLVAQAQTLQGVEAMQRTLTLLAAGLAHQKPFTVEQLADLVDLADLPVVAGVINEAIKKVAARVPPATPQTETPAAVQ